MSDDMTAREPEELTRLFDERANAADAAGIGALYEEHAVMAYPPSGETRGRDSIQTLWETILVHAPHCDIETPRPTLVSGDIALTSTVARDGTGVWAQVVRRQADGTRFRLLDQPEMIPPSNQGPSS